MVRHPDKEMVKSWKHFDTSVKLCKQAHTAEKVSRFKGLLETLQTTFYKFEEDFEFYKQDTIVKTCKTETAFNADIEEEGEPRPAFPHNDAWSSDQMTRYVDIRDLLEDALEAAERSTEEPEATKDEVNLVVEEFKAECKGIVASVSKLKLEIENHGDKQMAANVAMNYENIIDKLQSRIKQDVRDKLNARLGLKDVADDADYTGPKMITKFGSFSEEQITELDYCSMMLARKYMPRVEEVKPSTDVVVATTSHQKPKEQVFLEKTRPPKFNGDDVEFPEFFRKWNSQVHKANLPEETELDKLRDAIPKTAKDQLYGVTKLDEAWNILKIRFGDEMLISKKLKSQLKSIQSDGKSDPERVISLKIKVRNIVTRLEAMGMGAALTHDSEFLSAVYCALPDRHKVRWLDTTKTKDRWTDMLTFLDRTYEQANEELTLLSVMGKEREKGGVRSAGVSASGTDTDGDGDRSRKQRA